MQEEKFGKTSPLLERERKLDLTDIKELQDLFWEFHFLRKNTGGLPEPFDPQRIEAHVRLSGSDLCQWKYKLLMEMDLIFRATLLKKRG